jgi:hypothetical protein
MEFTDRPFFFLHSDFIFIWLLEIGAWIFPASDLLSPSPL